MGYLALSCAVEIPNGDMQYKELTSGATGCPDGWSPSAQFVTDRATASKIVDTWRPLYSDTTLLNPDEQAAQARAYMIGIKTAIGSDTTRYIDSPRSYLGSLYGTEQMVTYNEWFYTLWCAFHGEYSGGTPPTTGDVNIALWAVDTVGTSYKSLGSLDLTAAHFDAGAWTSTKRWQHLTPVSMGNLLSTGWSGAGTTPGRLFVRVTAKNNATTGYLYAGLSSVKVFTLGPLEGPVNQLSGSAGTDRYILSRPTQLEATSPAELQAFYKGRRLAGGQWRGFDPSGGQVKRMWRASFVNLTEDDRRKILRMWRYNVGFPTNSGTAFGSPRPVALIWNQAEDLDVADAERVHTVHFASKPLFVDYFKAPGWIASSRTSMRYQTTLVFEEA